MAFGKDREVLKKVTSLREASNASRGKPRGVGGGGGWQRFQDQYKPSTLEPDTFRFLAGEYPYSQVNTDEKGSIFAGDGKTLLGTTTILLPYFIYTEHFDGRTNSSTICSAGPYADWKDQRDPCVGCDIYWESGGSKGGRMSRREMKAFSIYNHSTFHEIESTDYKTGAVKMNPKTNKPYTEWAKCQGRRCDACTAGRPTKKGHMQHYELGFGHFGQVKDYSKIIGKGCQSCKARSSIQELAYLCPHCKDAVIDMSTTHLTDQDIAKMVDSDVVCPHCRQKGLLEEIVECTTPDCPEALRAGIFDVDISMKKVAGAQGTNASTLLFTEFGPISDLDPSIEIKMFDLPKMFEPTSIEQQQDKFKQTVTARPGAPARQPVPASEVARNYGGTPPTGSGGMFNK